MIPKRFRAYDKRLKQWAYNGYHVIGEVTAFNAMSDYIMETRELTPEVSSSIDRWNDIIENQFTGLKSKDGTEIYEGDIVRYKPRYRHDGPESRVGQVYWQEFRAGWAVKKTEHANTDLFSCVQYGNECEVIGNIYDNPELLIS